MKIEITKVTDWQRVVDAARFTQGKKSLGHEPSDEFKKQMILSEPYTQPYRDPTNPNHVIPKWQKDMAQWCNKRMIFCTTDFNDFMPRKGFRCEKYLREYGMSGNETEVSV